MNILAIFIAAHIKTTNDIAITTTKRQQNYLPLLSEEIKFQCKQYYSV